MRYLRVTLRDTGDVIKATPDSNLRQVVLKSKGARALYGSLMRVMANCRGSGHCGLCLVRVIDDPSALTDRTKTEQHKLSAASPQSRLACQASICGDVTISLSKVFLNDQAKIAEEAKAAREELEEMKAAAE